MQRTGAWGVLALGLCAGLVARADVAPDPVAATGNLALMKDKAPNTRMESEDVRLTLHPSVALVEATFVMAQDGPDQTLEVGFPGEGVILQKSWSAHTPLHQFTATVNGAPVNATAKKVDVKYQAGPKGTQTRVETWHTFPVTLVQGKQTIIKVRYGVVAQRHWGEGYKSGEPERDGVWYILHTGSAWKGPIGSGRVVVEAADGVDPASILTVNHAQPAPSSKEKFQYHRLPQGAVRTAKGLEYTFRDLTPSQADNLEISYLAQPQNRLLGQYGVDNNAAVQRIKTLLP